MDSLILLFNSCFVTDKRIWLLACAQGCLHFSVSIFWILWAPTIVVRLSWLFLSQSFFIIYVVQSMYHDISSPAKYWKSCWSLGFQLLRYYASYSKQPLFVIFTAGRREGCESITHIPLFSRLKNAWEHHISLALWRWIIYPQWGLPEFCICSCGSLSNRSSLWLPGTNI